MKRASLLLFLALLVAWYTPPNLSYSQDVVPIGEPVVVESSTQEQTHEMGWNSFIEEMKQSDEFQSMGRFRQGRTLRKMNRPWRREAIQAYYMETAFAMGVVEPPTPLVNDDGTLADPPEQAIDWDAFFEVIWPYLLKFIEAWLGGL